MSIAQTLTTSFKQQLFEAVHDFSTDTFYMALYTANADIGAATTVYTATGEISGTGYTATGQVMTGISVSVTDTTAFVNFSNVVWTTGAFTALSFTTSTTQSLSSRLQTHGSVTTMTPRFCMGHWLKPTPT